jgi:hypothetical protein
MGGEKDTTEEPFSRRTPTFRNIAISNVTISHATKADIDVEGLPEMPITTLLLSNVFGSGKMGMLATNTDAMELHHVQLNPDEGEPFHIESSASLLLDDVTSRRPVAGSPVIRLTGSPGAILRDSRAFPGTKTFLSTSPGEMKTLKLFGNILDNATEPTEER